MQIFDKKMRFFAENKRFSGLIRFYAKKLKTDTAEVDLWGFLWLLYSRKKQPPNDNYIAVCLKNEYIRLSKNKPKFWFFNLEIGDKFCDLDLEIDIKNALFCLSKKERETIILHYFYGYSIEEIGCFCKVSRQTINMTKNRALKKLRNLVN